MQHPPQFLRFLQENGISLQEYTETPLKRRFIRFKENAINAPFLAKAKEELCVDIDSVPWFPDFYSLEASVKIANSSLFKAGKMYGMDIASGVACHALSIQPNDHILDLCCAPGAKLCYLFDLLVPNGTGTITGVDVSKHRLCTAKSIIQKYHLDRARLFLADGTSFRVPPPSRVGPHSLYQSDLYTPPSPPTSDKSCFLKPFFANRLIRDDKQNSPCLYDKVLVDAECTHDGSIVHIQKYIDKNWQGFESEFLAPQRLVSLSELQFSLLTNGFNMLKPAGLLVYSTCSFSVRQNEDIVDRFMRAVGNRVELMHVPYVVEGVPFPNAPACITSGLVFGEEIGEKTLRFSPRISGTSGLFIALFRKV